ncbi:hypothetical protein F2P79_000967 [Pimephales promelas]|nr:hypothetical protein F2P79_000967 [Pimephales promelas]
MTAGRRVEKTLKAHWKAAGSVALGSRAVFWPQGRGASLSGLREEDTRLASRKGEALLPVVFWVPPCLITLPTLGKPGARHGLQSTDRWRFVKPCPEPDSPSPHSRPLYGKCCSDIQQNASCCPRQKKDNHATCMPTSSDMRE